MENADWPALGQFWRSWHDGSNALLLAPRSAVAGTALWATLLRRVFAIGVLVCSRCAGPRGRRLLGAVGLAAQLPPSPSARRPVWGPVLTGVSAVPSRPPLRPAAAQPHARVRQRLGMRPLG